MAGEIFFPSFFLASSSTPASKKHSLLAPSSSEPDVVSPKHGRGEEGPVLLQVGLVFGVFLTSEGEMTIKRPLTLPVLPVAFTVPVIL